MRSSFAIIAVVPPGLEPPAAAELSRLGAQEVRPLRRAVACRSDLAGLYRMHLQARLPFRFLRELARFPCHDRFSLQQGIQRAVDWALWLPADRSFRVEVSGSLPLLNHSHYTALQVKNAVVDQQRQLWGERSRVDLEDPDLSLHLHLSPPGRGAATGSTAILSLDGGGGASLHRRGYRSAMGLAPLKENLAAGLIAHTGWDGRLPLVDPLCGSGTLLLEAAAMALDLAPGLISGAAGPAAPRRFGFERWPDFEPQLWQAAVATARSLGRDRLADGQPLAPLLGLEHDPAVLAQARSNAAQAGLADRIELQQADFRDLQPPPGPGVLVCNPPYGSRVGQGEELTELYSDLGRMLRERCSGWTLWLLSGNAALTAALRLKADARIPVSNGGIDCRWLRYRIR
jgi:putative N6-adenine-specific DNA methylase